MNKNNILDKLIKIKDLLYQKIFKINDTPQKVALGFGIGIFSGILPGTGPLAALFLAFVFRANRASALIGSLLTNTWLSFVTFILAIKTGSAIFKISWQSLKLEWMQIINNFSWKDLFSLPILRIVLPVITGYLVISLILGVLSYAIVLIILKNKLSHADKGRR